MNLHELLQISYEVSAAYDKGQPLVALATSGLCNTESSKKAFDKAISAIYQLGCVPAVLYIDKGKLCVGAAADSFSLMPSQSCKSVGIAQLPLALTDGVSAYVECSAAILMASLTGIHVVCSAHIGGSSCEHEPQNIAALRAYPTLLVGCGSAELCHIFERHTLPAYRICECPAPIGRTEYIDSARLASVCRTKWALGLTSGVGAVLDEDTSYEAAIVSSAKAAACIARLI